MTISTTPSPNWKGIEEKKRKKARARLFSEVEMTDVDWLWYPYIPRGKLTMLGGDPGQGKSFITQAIAATLSRGDPLPGQEWSHSDPKMILMLAGEDDISDTVKKRLYGLGADMAKIAVSDDNIIFDENGIRDVREMMEEFRPELLIIDPIVAYLGAKMDMNRSNEVRPILKSIIDIASDYNSAVIAVRHMRKQAVSGKSGKAIYNGMGSIDFTAAVRSEMQVDEGTTGQKYLMHIKANAGPKGKSIQYSITNDTFSWGQQVDDSVVKKEMKAVSKRFKDEDKARLFLFDLLRASPDGVPASDIYLKGKALGISDTKLKIVKKGIAVVVKDGLRWKWMLDPNTNYVVE